jgi:hypothetical protein
MAIYDKVLSPHALSRPVAGAPLALGGGRGLLLGFWFGWLRQLAARRSSSRGYFLSFQISYAPTTLHSHPMLLTHIRVL